MLTFNIIGVSLMLIVFAVEITLVIIHTPEKKMIKDIKANFLLGLFYLITGLSVKGLAFSVYSFFYYFSIFKPDLTWWLWIAGFLGCEFCHYYYHWLGHKTRVFWAAHVTHHSSEYFNISTGFRNNFLHVFYRFLFWSPLCLLGIPPAMILFFESITAIQNFLVHTEKIGKLGILDRIFNTPSNHRVHHGVNPEYIDKNLGGITLIYDHLFGTYAREVEPAIYGITHNIHTHNPYKIILHEYIRLKKELATIKGFSAKLRYLFSPPD
ncbi:sterol desaturase family protein [Chitinophagaceae bacterium 26-R-25]|nr:sterol desaturase family protein [Chitinophagaceae bacterium 26-R-25]